MIFSIDSAGKLLGLGLHEFIKDRMSIFDFLIVVLSLGEIIFLGGIE